MVQPVGLAPTGRLVQATYKGFLLGLSIDFPVGKKVFLGKKKCCGLLT